MTIPSPFKSWEEYFASCWCRELRNHGVILDFYHESETFVLFEGAKASFLRNGVLKDNIKSQQLLRGHKYTPDFKLILSSETPLYKKAKVAFRSLSEIDYERHHGLWSQVAQHSGEESVYLEVKGQGQGFSRGGEGKRRQATLNQKWLFQAEGIFTNLAEIGPGSKKSKNEGLFEKTFTPNKYLLTNSGVRARTLHYNPRSIKEWLKRL